MRQDAQQDAPICSADLPQRLRPRDVHVWVSMAGATAVKKRELQVLSPDEICRAHSIASKTQRCQFLHGRILLRHLLSLYVSRPAREIFFRQNRNGKPSLIDRVQGIHFNVTHTHSLLLIAVSCGRLLGIDAEFLCDHQDLGEVAAQFFSARELNQLKNGREKAKCKLFYRFWTGKEACVKAIGSRSSNRGFRMIDLSGANGRRTSRIRPGLYIKWFSPVPGAIAAVACDSFPINVRLLRWANFQAKGRGCG
jgi:4'-phosphopantetheinyl transferase